MNGATSANVMYVNVLAFFYCALVYLEVVVLVSSGCSNEFLK